MASIFRHLMQRLHAPVYACRLNELVRIITHQLQPGDRVLDVGCGIGALGRALMDHPMCPVDVTVIGLERTRRAQELITVHGYDGRTIPFGDSSFDVVILADVLHHETEAHHLIDQCIRVARRLLIVKDHKLDGPFARQRICLLDWAANHPYGVPCLYQYNTREQWRQSHQRHGLTIEQELTKLRLYPLPYRLLFTPRLQYMAILHVPGTGGRSE